MISPNPESRSSETNAKLRTLVACDDRQRGEAIRALLVRNDPDCLAQHVVPIELAADRAAHLAPGLVIVVLPERIELAYHAMRLLARALPTHVLAVGPADDPQLILRTLHEGGADEYLDAGRLEEEIPGALLRFRTRRSPVDAHQTGRVLSVLGPSGGSGSSTLAVNVATVLASQHGTCGLVDLRLTAGDLAALLDMHPRYGVADFCANLDRLDRSMFGQFFQRHESGVCLLAAPPDDNYLKTVTSQGVRQALAMARGELPYVVVDLDNDIGEVQLEALWQSDVIVMVLRLDYISLRNVRRVLEHLQHAGVDSERLQLVANRVGQRNQLSVVEAEQVLGRKVLDQIPDEPSRMNAAVNAGIPVVLHRPRARVSRRLSGLANRLNGHQR